MSYVEKFWRDATDKDVARVMNGEEVEARFSDVPDSVWSKVTQLVGAKRLNDTGAVWLSPNSNWRYCQVYDPPQWFLDKPEPGEGYRLLAKEPDEALQPGDEALWPGVGWKPSERAERGETQLEGYWYRRRIEQPKPVFKVGDWVKIAKPSPGVANTRLSWTSPMDEYDGRITQISKFRCDYPQQVLVTDTTQWHFHVNWLTPAEPPKPEPKHYSLQVGDTADTGNGFRITITEHGVEVT